MPQGDREPVGIFYAWWRGDPLPSLPSVRDLDIAIIADDQCAPVVPWLDAAAVRERLEEGHRLYVARIGGDVAGGGWCATVAAAIAELGVAIRLRPDERYVWDFVTLPEWRRRGVYAALLQAMLREEPAERFWVGHDYGNEGSARGVRRAGFTPVGPVYAGDDGLVFKPPALDERALACEALFGIPIAR